MESCIAVVIGEVEAGHGERRDEAVASEGFREWTRRPCQWFPDLVIGIFGGGNHRLIPLQRYWIVKVPQRK